MDLNNPHRRADGAGLGAPTRARGPMLCAACGGQTSTSPCSGCGRGPLLKGRYRLNVVIDERGNTRGYVGSDSMRPQARLAVRIVPLGTVVDDVEQRLRARLTTLRRLRHPGVQPWADADVVGAGDHRALCVVHKAVAGTSLARESADRGMDPVDVVAVLAELLSTMSALHHHTPAVSLGAMDPDRIIRRPDGSLVVLDPGDLVAALGSPDLVRNAPEARRGQWSPASDLYALGVVALSLLVGRPAATLADRNGWLNWEGVVDLDGPLKATLKAFLQPDPAARPQTAQAARRLLLAQGAPATAPLPDEPPTLLTARRGPPSGRHPRSTGPHALPPTSGNLRFSQARTAPGLPGPGARRRAQKPLAPEQSSLWARWFTLGWVAALLTICALGAQAVSSLTGLTRDAPWVLVWLDGEWEPSPDIASQADPPPRVPKVGAGETPEETVIGLTVEGSPPER